MERAACAFLIVHDVLSRRPVDIAATTANPDVTGL